jgi:hypothetical protein
MGDRQRWSEASHEQLVGVFRGLIQQERQKIQQKIQATGAEHSYYPAAIVRDQLDIQEVDRFSDDPLRKQRGKFFQQIRNAWDVLAYEHYRHEQPLNPHGEPDPPDFYHQYEARNALAFSYNIARERNEPSPEIIQLDPLQVKILDALAEAADIPHHRGQTAIEIPERFQ